MAPEELLERLREIARREGVSLAHVMREGLEWRARQRPRRGHAVGGRRRLPSSAEANRQGGEHADTNQATLGLGGRTRGGRGCGRHQRGDAERGRHGRHRAGRGRISNGVQPPSRAVEEGQPGQRGRGGGTRRASWKPSSSSARIPERDLGCEPMEAAPRHSRPQRAGRSRPARASPDVDVGRTERGALSVRAAPHSADYSRTRTSPAGRRRRSR